MRVFCRTRANGLDFLPGFPCREAGPPRQIWAWAHADPPENPVTMAQSGRYG
jgi:hypothetical protein